MRIAKPLLLVLTPIGVVVGLIHGYRVAGGLVVLVAGMLMIVGVAAFTVVMAIRRERRAEPRGPDPGDPSLTGGTDPDR